MNRSKGVFLVLATGFAVAFLFKRASGVGAMFIRLLRGRVVLSGRLCLRQFRPCRPTGGPNRGLVQRTGSAIKGSV